MKKHNEQTLFESINSLRETMAVMEGPFDPLVKPVLNKAAEYAKPAFTAAKDYASWAKKGYNNPDLAKIQPNNTSAMHSGARTGADVNALVNSPNAKGAAVAGGAGAATLGTAAMYGDKAEHPEKVPPQDMATHGSGYLDTNNTGYKYHPYDDSDETGTVIGINGENETGAAAQPSTTENPWDAIIHKIVTDTGMSPEDAYSAISMELDNPNASPDPQEVANRVLATHAAPTAAPTDAVPAANKSHNWKAIYDLNKQVIGKNPNKIIPGQQLKMPNGSTYTVKSGDSLWKISQMQQPTPPATPGMPGIAQAKPETTSVKESSEHVSFNNEDSLARIIQLSKW